MVLYLVPRWDTSEQRCVRVFRACMLSPHAIAFGVVGIDGQLLQAICMLSMSTLRLRCLSLGSSVESARLHECLFVYCHGCGLLLVIS